MIIKDQLELFCKVKINIQLISFILKNLLYFRNVGGELQSVFILECVKIFKKHIFGSNFPKIQNFGLKFWDKLLIGPKNYAKNLRSTPGSKIPKNTF